MHIVYFMSRLPKQKFWAYGAGNYVANIAQIMVKHGHKVSIVTEYSEDLHIEWNGIDIYYISAAKGFKDNGKKMPTYKKALKNLFRSIRYNRKVSELNKCCKVDIVQSVDSYGLILFRKKDIPYIVRRSGYSSLWMGAEKESFVFKDCFKTDRRLDIVLTQYAVSRADKILAPSYLVADITKDKLKREVTVIESPVLIENINQFILREPELRENKYFITFGANTNRKCIRMLATMMDRILDKYPDMKYVVIGKDRSVLYKGDYKNSSVIYDEHVIKHKDRFVFMGEMTDKDRLYSIVKNSFCCILPTRVDNLPNTILEAMSLGKIVISSTGENRTSVEQLITDGENGFLFPVDDGEEMLKKIDDIMGLDKDKKMEVEKKAKERVKDLTPDKVYEKMMEIYEEVIDLY